MKKRKSSIPAKEKQPHSPPKTLTLTLNQAIEQAKYYHHLGNWQQAQLLYQHVLQAQPQQSDALNFFNQLGCALNDQGQMAQAVKCFQYVLSLNPHHAETHNNLGIALAKQGESALAKIHFERAVALKADHLEALYNLGIILNEEKQFTRAIVCYQQALSLGYCYERTYNNLGNAYNGLDDFELAISCYQKALALNPQYVEAHNNLGTVYQKQKRFAEAATCLQQAIQLKPDYLPSYHNLGIVLRELEKFTEALACFHQILSLDLKNAQAYLEIGSTLASQNKFTEAVTYYQQALALKANQIEVYIELAGVYRKQGLLKETSQYLRQALKLQPRDAGNHDNILFQLNALPDFTNREIFAAHQQFNEQHVKPLAVNIQTHRNTRQPQRRLKIGYISPDFHRHSVTYFIEPILAHHDHEQFEIVGYYNQNKHDSFTERLQSHTDHWRDCFTMSDEALTKTIREDQIDILIDLAGHTGNNRLLVLARKPAPIQMTYLGYPRSTGVETIDYRLTDNYVDVQGINEEFNSEQLIKLPNSYFCYRPLDNAPAINELPAKERGYITFGCFNQLGKLTTAMQILWVKLLRTIPNAKLLLKNDSFRDEPTRQNLINKLIQLGVAVEQLLLEPAIPDVHEHLKLYQHVDIALDTYPYNGATTTCEALWMGVPVISLQGETQVARMGLSILSTVGLSEWVASTPEEYLQLCLKFANDINQLQQLRQTMRQRLQASPLLDGVTFTRHLEQIYRQVWKKWCE